MGIICSKKKKQQTKHENLIMGNMRLYVEVCYKEKQLCYYLQWKKGRNN